MILRCILPASLKIRCARIDLNNRKGYKLMSGQMSRLLGSFGPALQDITHYSGRQATVVDQLKITRKRLS